LSTQTRLIGWSAARKYDIPLIGFSEWQALAPACAIDSEMLMNRLRQLADALPDAVSAALDQALAEGLDREVVTLWQAAHRARQR
jgi:hypothetical protein